MVRVYIIDAEFTQSMDYNSDNDAYIVLKLGNKIIKDTQVEQDQNNPKFYKCFEIEHEFPGPSTLSINFYDEDSIRPDDLIGTTEIDVERRYFD